MNITIISVTEKGGAGYASKNLYMGLKALGVNVNYISFETLNAHPGNRLQRLYRWWHVRKNVNRNYRYLKDAPAGFDYFTFSRTGYKDLKDHPLVKSADVINLHWISNLVDYKSFFPKLKKPVIWTLHDVNPFTGGCHYTFGCDHFLKDCYDCMQLAERVKHFAARDNFNLKLDSLKSLTDDRTLVVSPSKWLKSLSEKSTMFKRYRHFHIPYGVETDKFKPYGKADCRKEFQIDENKFVILFVGTSLTEHRKGFDIILQLRDLMKENTEVLFVAAGKSGDQDDGVLNLGYIEDKNTIACAYSAADVFLIPSREDNLPNTMLEALCCGTPVIGFKTGGIVDAITDGKNGFTVEKEDVAGIHGHILEMIADNNRFNRQQIAAEAAEKYKLSRQANAYKELFELIAGKN
jgi:glycosyltransferase involved in cell wall biosynthesis